jgi:WD40 repeat protein
LQIAVISIPQLGAHSSICVQRVVGADRKIEWLMASEKKKFKKPAEGSSSTLWIVLGTGAALLLCVCGGVGMGVGLMLPAWRKAAEVAQKDLGAKMPDGPGDADARDLVRLPEVRVELPAHLHLKEKPHLVLDPQGHSATVARVMLTPDKRQVVTASMDRSVRVWDVETGEVVRVFRMPAGPGDEGALYAAALSPDGTRLAVSGVPIGRGKLGVFIYLIDMQTGQVQNVLTGHRNFLSDLAFSADGKTLISSCHDLTVRLWDLTAAGAFKELPHPDRVRQAFLSPSGERVVSVTYDQRVFLWNAASGQMICELKEPRAPYISVAWSPSSSTIVTGSVDGALQVWSADGAFQKQVKIVQGRKLQPATIQFANENEVVYGGVEFKGETGIVNLQTGQRRDVPLHSNTVVHASLSADRTLAVSTGGDDHDTFVWRVADGSVVQHLKGTGKVVWGVGWSRDGKTIAWGNTNRGQPHLAQPPLERTFRLEDLDWGPAPNADFVRLPASVDGYSLESIDFFQMAIKKDGNPLHVWKSPLPDDRIYCFTPIPGGRAVVGTGFALFLVDLKTNQVVHSFDGHSGSVFGVSPSPDGRYFLTGASDQTVKLWRPEQQEPLLTLFATGDDWIVWSREGYYAASAYGERLMGWQVNIGTDRLAMYYPAAYFRASLYRPEAIKKLPQTGDMQKALALTDSRGGVRSVGQVLPPAVEITSPGGAAKINKRRLEVKAVAKSVGEHPVTALRLLVDGRPYHGEKGVRRFDTPKLGEVDGVWTVDLSPGKHVLAVLAESSASKSVSSVREVTVDGVGKEELPNLYMVSIGISEYPGKMALKYAAKDAIVLEKTVRAKTAGVFNNVETKLITDKKATRTEIEASLKWLESKMTAGDVGILFFGGHGARDPRGKFYLVPVDFNERNLEKTCVSGDLVKQTLASMPGKLIAMLDACHSGTLSEAQRGRADDLVRDLVSEEYGVVCMCSSLGREFSLESTVVEHGYFTLGMIEGLSGKADYNKDGFVYIHEVDYYASRRVRELSDGAQNPVTGRPPSIRSFPLSRP